MLGEEGLERRERRDILLGQLIADRFAQRMIVRRIDLRVVARGIDRGHNGEKRWAGVELP